MISNYPISLAEQCSESPKKSTFIVNFDDIRPMMYSFFFKGLTLSSAKGIVFLSQLLFYSPKSTTLMCAEKTGGFNLVNYRHSSGVYHEQETEDLHRRI